MRSRFAARPARLALAAVAAVALTATATATATATTDSRGSAARACGTKDLTFKLSSETQAGGYFLVTAKAKSGVTCYLKGVFPSASFGSAADTEVAPAEHAVSENVVLSGSTRAYAGINPKTTNNDYGKEFDRLHLSIAGDEANSLTLDLPETALVDRPVATNWHADPADAVPFSD
ncbi:hypothetical protein GCM10010313_19120 [Streptomyces violarus]|uniref:DUF4232 domain-containing protein n=1 Tax=Streptomyces violarus TaxID=67380 RepID=A0A7W5F0E4_9ACTN|nr:MULTISPECIES: DUF4232 domain-containing protein [Streptomyces]MBB3075436.1 hypothetical protein [Streptomyces violarus]WRT98040.1 DUF4232 domain-containing protein [Streptomyces sp. CGMCC 4.1772]GHD03737.1 hypothetical protein GCM10010313_19120 [Streptomyces violarus]